MAKLRKHLATTRVRPGAAVIVTAALAAAAQAQEPTLKPVTVNERSAPSADVTGFGDQPLARTPISAAVIDAQQIEAGGARRLADLMKLDASVSDAYNSVGYWDYATVRGFVLDNKYNYRREGLPISAETFIPLDNKQRVELLKGSSGIQAGTSAPGGLIHYAVKRPTEADLRRVTLEVSQRGGLYGHADLGGRFGAGKEFGYRLNLAAENIRSHLPRTDGQRHLFALATDWRLSRDSVLEAEVEYSRRSQPSQAGLSLLGNQLPAPEPRLQINSQPWSLPVVLQGLTGTLRFEQALGRDWRWSAQAGTQRLKSDDRIAFPFGCTDSNGVDYYADRYCPNGDFDLYDFRSEDERRRISAAQLQLKGKVQTGGVQHSLSFGLLRSHTRDRFGLQAYNYVGTGNLFTLPVFAPAPDALDQSTNRDERNTELSVFDAIAWNERLSTWLGLRHSRIERDSVRTDGSRPTRYGDGFTTPWLAVSYQLTPLTMLYASWGQGIESQVVPNRDTQYSNAGVALPSLKSRQHELGVKSSSGSLAWQLAYFGITRPVTNLDACNRLGISPCEGGFDGEAEHRGLEASAQWRGGPWSLGGGVTLLHARRQGSVTEPATNGQRPTNVPNWIARAQAGYRFAAGWQLDASLSHEGRRAVLPDGSITLPAWTQIDAALRHETQLGGASTRWTLAVENLFDRRFFKESPYQFGHVYLFPAAPRTVRLSVQLSL